MTCSRSLSTHQAPRCHIICSKSLEMEYDTIVAMMEQEQTDREQSASPKSEVAAVKEPSQLLEEVCVFL
jgi:hypothetical protein